MKTCAMAIRTHIVLAIFAVSAANSARAQTVAIPKPAAPVTTRAVAVPPPAPPNAEIVDRFVQSVEQSTNYPQAGKLFIATEWKKRRGTPAADAFLDEALAALYPEFKSALDAQQASAGSIDGMLQLVEHADPYVAVNAAGLAAETLVEQERIVEAAALLKKMTSVHEDWRERTTSKDHILFLAGFTALQTLDYDRAESLLSEFMQNYPLAPERLRRSAEQMLKELAGRQPDALG